MEIIDFRIPFNFKDKIAYIKERLTFKDIAKFYDLQYSEYSNFRCWFHSEEHASARIHLRNSNEIYTCYAGCGSGDVVWAIQKLENFKTCFEAVDFILKYMPLNNIIYKQKKINSLNLCRCPEIFSLIYNYGSKGSDYLLQRGISQKTQMDFNVFTLKKNIDSLLNVSQRAYLQHLGLFNFTDNTLNLYNRVIMPVTNVTDSTKLIGFIARNYTNEDPKYIYGVDSGLNFNKKGFFGWSNFINNFNAINTNNRSNKNISLFIVEGPIDCMAIYQNVTKYVLSTFGTVFTKSQVDILKLLLYNNFISQVIINYDADSSGEHATALLLKILEADFRGRVKTMSLPKGEDPASYLYKYNKFK